MPPLRCNKLSIPIKTEQEKGSFSYIFVQRLGTLEIEPMGVCYDTYV